MFGVGAFVLENKGAVHPTFLGNVELTAMGGKRTLAFCVGRFVVELLNRGRPERQQPRQPQGNIRGG